MYWPLNALLRLRVRRAWAVVMLAYDQTYIATAKEVILIAFSQRGCCLHNEKSIKGMSSSLTWFVDTKDSLRVNRRT